MVSRDEKTARLSRIGLHDGGCPGSLVRVLVVGRVSRLYGDAGQAAGSGLAFSLRYSPGHGGDRRYHTQTVHRQHQAGRRDPQGAAYGIVISAASVSPAGAGGSGGCRRNRSLLPPVDLGCRRYFRRRNDQGGAVWVDKSGATRGAASVTGVEKPMRAHRSFLFVCDVVSRSSSATRRTANRTSLISKLICSTLTPQSITSTGPASNTSIRAHPPAPSARS